MFDNVVNKENDQLLINNQSFNNPHGNLKLNSISNDFQDHYNPVPQRTFNKFHHQVYQEFLYNTLASTPVEPRLTAADISRPEPLKKHKRNFQIDI